MSRREKQALANALREQLSVTEKMWMDQVSPAQIVGYLTGMVKATIMELETSK